MIVEPESLSAGTVIGDRYRLERLLGKGGFGAVFAASDEKSRQRVALKILSPRMFEDAGGAARVHREAELARRLSHPNTVRVLDTGSDKSGFYYIAFELLEGRSVEAALRDDGPFSPKRAALIAMEVLSALEEAHANGIIHRDIKPGNIFIVNPGVSGTGGTVNTNASERVKVLDFGIAKSTNPHTRQGLTRDGTSVGTPAYMPPEQMLGQPLAPSTDLYALGLVLAEMVLGESPYGAEPSGMAVIALRLDGKPVPFPEQLIASPLGPFLKRATADVVYRFASAREMRTALSSLSTQLSDRAAARPSRRSFTDAATHAMAMKGGGTAAMPAGSPGAGASPTSSPLASSFAVESPLVGSGVPDPRGSSRSLAKAAPDSRPAHSMGNAMSHSTGNAMDHSAGHALAKTALDSATSSRNRLAETTNDYNAPQTSNRGAIFSSQKQRLDKTILEDGPSPPPSWNTAPATAQNPKPTRRGAVVVVVVIACAIVIAALLAAFYFLHRRGVV